MLTVARGQVVTPAGSREADVVVEDGRIAAIVPPGEGGGETVDAAGCFVVPGGVDPHTHLLGDIAAASVSAAFGGTTTALSFTAPAPGESAVEAFVRARDEHAPLSAVDVGLHASVWEPERLTEAELGELHKLGACGIKVFLAYSELGIMTSDRRLYEIMRDCARFGLLVQVHCENDGVVRALVDELLAAGKREARFFAESRPAGAEEEAVNRALAVGAIAGCTVYVVHVSTSGGVGHVRAARARGQSVYAEACVHHLVLASARYDRPDAQRFLTAPPLRSGDHMQALWQGLADGTLDAVGTDHAQVPYQPEPRTDDFAGMAYGLAGIEVRLPLLLSRGRERGIPLERLVELSAAGPARCFGLYPRKGAVATGSDADLVVWDPDAEWTIQAESLHDGHAETPFAGLDVRGRVRSVLLRGEPLVLEGELVGAADAGSFLPARAGTPAEVG